MLAISVGATDAHRGIRRIRLAQNEWRRGSSSAKVAAETMAMHAQAGFAGADLRDESRQIDREPAGRVPAARPASGESGGLAERGVHPSLPARLLRPKRLQHIGIEPQGGRDLDPGRLGSTALHLRPL